MTYSKSGFFQVLLNYTVVFKQILLVWMSICEWTAVFSYTRLDWIRQTHEYDNIEVDFVQSTIRECFSFLQKYSLGDTVCAQRPGFINAVCREVGCKRASVIHRERALRLCRYDGAALLSSIETYDQRRETWQLIESSMSAQRCDAGLTVARIRWHLTIFYDFVWFFHTELRFCRLLSSSPFHLWLVVWRARIFFKNHFRSFEITIGFALCIFLIISAS